MFARINKVLYFCICYICCCWLPSAETSLFLSRRWRWRRFSWGPVQSRKVKERKRAKKVRSQTRSFPQVPLRELGRVGRAVEGVFGGVGGCPAGGTALLLASIVGGSRGPNKPNRNILRQIAKFVIIVYCKIIIIIWIQFTSKKPCIR